MDRAEPRHWLSSSYDVYEGGALRSTLRRTSLFRSTAEFRIRGRPYRIRKEGFRGDFLLLSREEVLWRARKRGVFKSGFLIRPGEDTPSTEAEDAGASSAPRGGGLFDEATLRPASSLRRTMELRSDGKTLGRIRPGGAFSRKILLELPDGMPEELQVFLLWLTTKMWRDAAAAAAGGS